MNPYQPPDDDESQLDRIERRFELHHGDCLDVLKTLADCSVDAIVTDPPYGLSFMGKRWDYDVPTEAVWVECLRVLKPGGHLLAFAGTRTQHRMAVRIEDAGFEIRDMIAWVYGSGFPKSMDISKQLDKMDASQKQEERRLRFTEWVRSTGVTSRQIDEATGTNMGGHYTTAASQPAIMTREHLEACRGLFGSVPEWVEQEADIRSVESKNFAGREVIGSHNSTSPGCNMRTGILATEKDPVGNLTAPATEAAKQWEGWGTAIKPALEPITLARKPPIGTIAANVLEHGTGGLNIGACRVGTETVRTNAKVKGSSFSSVGDAQGFNGCPASEHTGRWPANFIHDGSEEVLALFPETTSGQPAGVKAGNNNNVFGQFAGGIPVTGFGDSGSAARFFYCAKASRDDRDEGLPMDQHSSHPTVKPTDLMRYLCRLITPPNGIVLDPFMGSGSTGKAAMAEGFRFIGIEREAEYIEIARARISAEAEKPRQLSLF